MLKRLAIGLMAMMALLVVSGALFISSPAFFNTLNRFMPEGWTIQRLERNFSLENQSVLLPAFSVNYQTCSVVEIAPIQFHWQSPNIVSSEKVTLDYQCLLDLPSSESQPREFSFTPILALMPEMMLEVNQIAWKNLPETLSPSIKQLLTEPAELKASYLNGTLSAEINQQAVKFDGKLADLVFTGNLSYQPSETEKHNLFFTTQLNENLLDLPNKFEGDYHWIYPSNVVEDPILREGSALLNWSPNEENALVGTAQVRFEKEPKNTLNLPFKFDFKSLYVYQGKFNWEWLPDFPINGSTTATFTPKSIMQGKIFPLETEFRLNLFSHDKNTLSLATTKGIIKDKETFELPLTLSGNVKYNSFILTSLSTIYANEKGMRFSPKSVFNIISGKERFITINELKIPLGDIEFNRYGVTGRFQANFKGETPDFRNIELNLDGSAKNFKMGFLDYFDDFNGKQNGQDIWQWQLNGKAHLNALNSQIDLQGRGQWHADLVQIDQLDGLLADVKKPSMVLEKTQLSLNKSIKFNTEKWTLDGEAKLKSPALRFDYGGKLTNTEAMLNINGEIENLNFNGKLQAGKIGPIFVNGHRELTEQTQSSLFHGKLTWKAQPADVFQPLIPERTDWIIKNGTVSGNTVFSTKPTGSINASGQISIKNGDISMPKGEINGIEFTLPYQLNDTQLKFGRNKPIAVNIDEVNVGLPIRNIHVNVSGYYPYSRNKPLNLNKLTMNLLDGELKVESFALPQGKPAYLELKHIRFESILEVAQYQQIDLRGRASARLPFWLNGLPCYICNGELQQESPSTLKMSKEIMDAIAKSSGYSEQILVYLLNDTTINELKSRLHLTKSGDLTLNSQLKMKLNQQENARVNFNYNHKENLFQLWHLINTGAYVEQDIENHLYQKLDNQKLDNLK